MSSKTKTINKKINNINNKIKSIKNKIKRKPNPRRLRAGRKRKFIPAANIKNLNKDFKVLYQDGTTVKVTGRDLVYKIPDDLEDQDNSGVITVIPANPCYWIGTRIAALAQGYQNYRPLDMKFTYIPQCAVTQQGNVIAGTLWNQAPSGDNLQQSLRTSNGGMLSQCYKGFTSTVRLKSNLQYNLYKTAGTFDQESNPFIYMAIAVACKSGEKSIIPGYFYVTWSYLLKNPIGNTNIFYNSGLTDYGDIKDNDDENRTFVFLNPEDQDLPMGAIMQLDKDSEGENFVTYNGSNYEMDDGDIVWCFSNSTISTVEAISRNTKGVLYMETEYTPAFDERGPGMSQFIVQGEDPDTWELTMFMKSTVIELQGGTRYMYVTDYMGFGDPDLIIGQFTGSYYGYRIDEYGDNIGIRFKIPKSQVTIQIIGANKNQNQAKKSKYIPRRKQKKLLASTSFKILEIRDKPQKPQIMPCLDKIKEKEREKSTSKEKKMKTSKSDKYYTNLQPIFED